jgi:hypothetical protein
MEPYSLSPVVGKQPNKGFEFLSKLSIPRQFRGQAYHGCFSTMGSINTAVVQRTFGLFEVYHAEHGKALLSILSAISNRTIGKDKESFIRYGTDLTYSEFILAHNPLTAILSSVSLAFAFVQTREYFSSLTFSIFILIFNTTSVHRLDTSSPNSANNKPDTVYI